MPSQKPIIIYVDDNHDDLTAFQINFNRSVLSGFYDLRCYDDPKNGLTDLVIDGAALILTDYNFKGLEHNPGKKALNLIERVRRYDPFLPVICLTGNNNTDVMKEVMIAGAHDFVPKSDNFDNLLTEVLEPFLRPVYPYPIGRPIVMIKVGGSIQDAELPLPQKYRGIDNIVASALRLQREGYQVIFSVGAGPLGDILKQRRDLARIINGEDSEFDKTEFEREFPYEIKRALDSNAKYVQRRLRARKKDPACFIFRPESLKSLRLLDTALLDGQIIITTTAPRAITLPKNPDDPSAGEVLSESDYQTLKLAQYFGTNRILIAKDTPGIFRFDPLRGYNPNAMNPNVGWRRAQRANEYLARVNATDLLNQTISRIGTDNRGGHLFEDAALRAMLETDIEVCVVCPEYRHFAPQGKPILPEITFPPNVSNKINF